jgi:hypothetical protein
VEADTIKECAKLLNFKTSWFKNFNPYVLSNGCGLSNLVQKNKLKLISLFKIYTLFLRPLST